MVNGDVEAGTGDTPSQWKHDQPDATHHATWTDEVAQSGHRALKTVVAQGAQPTWIATRQSGISIVGGARYRVEAWVKASGVQGTAGWYLHVGNATNSMLLAPMLDAGAGTYDWKQVELEFTAPREADRLSLGTVLPGLAPPGTTTSALHDWKVGSWRFIRRLCNECNCRRMHGRRRMTNGQTALLTIAWWRER